MSEKTIPNPSDTRTVLRSGPQNFTIHSLPRLDLALGGRVSRLPYSLRVLLENVLRGAKNDEAGRRAVEAVACWDAAAEPAGEIGFVPARVLLQDFTGVPCVADLAAMRDAVARMGGDPARINPIQPVDLVIDHSVQVDAFGNREAIFTNTRLEFERNRERYGFLRWGQGAFDNFRVVPPSTGIVHQVNLEYLARVVFTRETPGGWEAYPDTLVGTDSHTPMVNALGVLGWGVGGIEAEAAMLGQPISMLVPQVVGVKLKGCLPAGSTATDLVLTVTQMLRRSGVVGKFVEFFGEGVSSLGVADRAVLSNMAPEYGATMGFFPVDAQTLEYLRFTGRSEEQVALVEDYCRSQMLFREEGGPDPDFSQVVDLDLATVAPCIAGPRRPQDRIDLGAAKTGFRSALVEMLQTKGIDLHKGDVERYLANGVSTNEETIDDRAVLTRRVMVGEGEGAYTLTHGDVVIAAITSCTNTSNPALLIAAGLLARNARERGIRPKPWVKTSFAPGSQVAPKYLAAAGLLPSLEQLGFNVVGFGCTTCIGNSGPLPEPVGKAVDEGHLIVAAVLSGNRNFEGRINPQCRANYLASPPLVVAYALAGTMNIDLTSEPLGMDSHGAPVMLADLWPSSAEVAKLVAAHVTSESFRESYASVFDGGDIWKSMPVPEGQRFAWDPGSTYLKPPPFFEKTGREPEAVGDLRGARVLVMVGDSVTTDHISPAGSIAPNSPAAHYLKSLGVEPKDFNSYGSRRGNHEVMMRGTFANIRLRNLLAPGTEGCVTVHQPSNNKMSIYDAAMRYKAEDVPLVVLAGKEYGSGSSRDWAAKGPALLGVRAVIAQSFERIHRSNLVGMGILPLLFPDGQDRETLGLTGLETVEILGVADALTVAGGLREVTVRATPPAGIAVEFRAIARIDTPDEVAYFRHGGILPYVLRQLL